ncbi:serine acetyltransferase [Rathayibacter sp. VKM Ac-2760]|uniref:serine O-acetyltransferase n=1 Tax=Rathayibacter sp. VKM Ac-2760 TaxID=2609253 RepID=UPI00244B395B|nr:serine acetyltransferase [Rathayibacter sp. VKM Ac-2760]
MTLTDEELRSLPRTIRTREDLRAFVLADQMAHGVSAWRFDSRWRHPVVHYQRLLRRVEFLRAQKGAAARAARFVARFRLQRAGLRTGISIGPGVFGPGLSIAHYGTLVVNARARVGAFCRIHPTVTIGIAQGGVPTIGDFVYIGPGAVIYGAVTIGDGAVIGANAVVNRDVAAGVTVAGAPARVVASRDSASMMPAAFARVESAKR